ncbi:Cpr72Ea [Drosophila busckii]|uniref:Cpr72Ea n=1 Tax=Drosophila busckii TaxID=30019 RepID=A0A0M4EKW5_DROBS|nr:Cpr72Ea [Drosophila busckii]
MQLQVLALVALSLASLAQGIAIYPYAYTAVGSTLLTPTQQQYYSQDALGQYAYGYAEPHSSKHEMRSLDGTTRGAYSYRDAAGQLQRVEYTADDAGFHVAATNLPRAVQSNSEPAESAEVAAARQTHLAAHEQARLRTADPAPAPAPAPIADTPEVAAAKSVHLQRVASEKLRNELLGSAAVAVPVSIARSQVIVPSVYGYKIPQYYNSGFYYYN